MLEDLANRRLQRLESQLSQLREDLEELDADLTAEERDAFLAPAESALERAQRRRRTIEQGSNPLDSDFYDRYVSALDDLDIRLDNLHWITGYVELHARQRTEDAETIDDIGAVCSEVCDAMNISITVLPTIWESYATLPLEESGGDIYSLLVPRHANPRQYQPLIAHELGHALVDRVGMDDDYRDRAWEIDEGWGGEQGEFANYWREWYNEFFCDACGVLTFGPAYVYAISDYLHNQRPYNVFDEHPPSALRLKFVNRLAEEEFPDPAYQSVRPVIASVEEHLRYQEQNKREDFESYVDEELLRIVGDAGLEEVTIELPRITDRVHSDIALDDVDPDIRYRVKVNRKWTQNGG